MDETWMKLYEIKSSHRRFSFIRYKYFESDFVLCIHHCPSETGVLSTEMDCQFKHKKCLHEKYF